MIMENNELPESWLESQLDDVLIKIVGGGTPSKTNAAYYQGNIPWMSVKDMNKHILTDTTDHITEEAVNNSSTNIIPSGTPIIATRMSLGKIIIANFDSAINQDLKALFLPNNVSRNYLVHWYRSNSSRIESLGTGTTVKGIRLEVLKSLKFPLPPLAEQKVIAEKLDTMLAQVEETKAELESTLVTLKQFRQSVLAHAVSGKLTEQWREGKEFDIEEEINQIQKSRLKLHSDDSDIHFHRTGKKLRPYDYSTLAIGDVVRDIPESWHLLKLGDIVSYLTDYHANGSYEILKKNVEIKNEIDSVCMIRATNFEKDNFEDLFVYISDDAYEFLGKSKLYGGEILVGKIGNAGSVYLLPKLDKKMSLGMNLFALRFNETLISTKYLYLFLTSYVGEENIKKYVRGVATKSIDKKSLRSVIINYPSYEEQNEIVRRVESMFAAADETEQDVKDALARVNQLTQSILAKAFRGELTEQWRNDNPDLITGDHSAEALLAKIKAEREAAKPVKRGKKAIA